MPYYIRNTPCDIDFLSDEGVSEYLEDVLSDLPPDIIELEVAKSLFFCMRSKYNLNQISELLKDVDWNAQPFELQSIAVGLKLFRQV